MSEFKQSHKINNMDVIKWAKEYDGLPFHALLTDAPYHLTTITKRFGKKGSAPAKFGTDGVFSRSSRGFMGQQWDGGDIAFQPETWSLLGQHMYPGAFGMTFGGARTFHRMAVAIEEAGFIIHPTIAWIYFQGFPKSHGVKGDARFKGYKYGLQALKPAMEPIIVFQKPYDGRPLDNIQATGAGVMNIDGTRIPTTDRVPVNTFDDGMKPFGKGAGHKFTSRLNNAGRYPSNVILESDAAQSMDSKTGGSKMFKVVQSQFDFNDPFCVAPKVSLKERDAGLEKFKTKKFGQSNQSKAEIKRGHNVSLNDSIGLNRIKERKNDHPTLKPIDLTTYLAKLLLPPSDFPDRKLLVPFSGASSEMIGGLLAGWDYVEGIELGKEYCKIGEARIKYWRGRK